MDRVIRDLGQVRVALVGALPDECGGGVAYQDDDGIIWVLLETERMPLEAAEPDELAGWVDLGYEVIAAGEPVTVADQVHRFGADLETGRRAFWAFAWEWWELEQLSRI